MKLWAGVFYAAKFRGDVFSDRIHHPDNFVG